MLVAGLLALVGPVRLAPAQDRLPRDPSAELQGRIVSAILLERIDRPDEPIDERTAQIIRNQLRSAVGAEYDAEVVSTDLTHLNRLGLFGQVEVHVEPRPDGTVALVYRVLERPIIQDVQVVGNRRLTDRQIAEVVPLTPGTPVDPVLIARAAEDIKALYRRRGYANVHVTVDEQELAETGIVLFRIQERQRIRVTDIRFVDATGAQLAFTPRRLRSAIRTRIAGPFRTGALDDDVLADDVAALTRFYEDRGYLDVRVDREVTYSPDGREAIVTFLIEQGPIYLLRSVRVYYPDRARFYPTMEQAERARQPGEQLLRLAPPGIEHSVAVYPIGVFAPEQITAMMELKPGDVLSRLRLERSIQAVRDAYGKLGYTDARVIPAPIRDEREPLVDVLVEIHEGERYRTGEVIIRGNEITKDSVIRRVLPLRPDRPLDTTAVAEAERRLSRELALFEPGSPRVTIQQPDPLEPEYRDVLVEVAEWNTGRFSIGAAVSNDLGVIGSIIYEQRNFDVTDTPDSFGELLTGRAFRGGGQTFRIELAPGDVLERYAISLSEPSLYGSSYAGSGTVFFRAQDLRDFDEERFGTHLRLSRAFGQRWRGDLRLRAESINLQNIDADAPTDIFDVQDRNTLTAIGTGFARTTVDDRFIPTRGSRLELSIEQIGALGGDFDFTRLGLEHALFVPVHEDFLGRRTVLSFTTRIGYIPQDADVVPIYERFFLGGQSFRGFGYRGVSPVGVRNDTGEPSDDPVGGTWSFFAGAEIRQPVWRDIVAVVAFVDTGTVLKGFGFEDYRVSVGTGLRVTIPGLTPVPLALDLGFPLLRERTDDERLITFSVDVPF